MPKSEIDPTKVKRKLMEVFGEDMHARRVLALSNVTTGALGVHAIGLGLAGAESLNLKHAIKQVDRLLSNSGLDVWKFFESWVPFVLAQRKEAIVALDWTDFDSDGQSTIALHLITDRGRATPLVWKTVNKSELGSILVTRETGETRPPKDWASPNGRAIRLRNARVTHKKSHSRRGGLRTRSENERGLVPGHERSSRIRNCNHQAIRSPLHH